MKPELKVHGLARRQASLVQRSAALELGMTEAEIEHRLRRGYWQRLHPGVYLVGVSEPSWEQRARAAVLAAPGSVLSHRAAGRWWALDGLADEVVDLTIPHAGGARVQGAKVHRARSLSAPDVTVHSGVPITTVGRTLLDLGRYLGPRHLEIALESALRRGITSADALAGLAAGSDARVPGVKVLRAVLVGREPGRPAGSAAEVEFALALRIGGAPPGERQYVLKLPQGTTYVLDRAWPDLKVAVEIDGFAFHSGRQQHSADLVRQNEIVRAGWTLLRYAPSQVAARPRAVAGEVIEVLEAARRPRLGVFARSATG